MTIHLSPWLRAALAAVFVAVPVASVSCGGPDFTRATADGGATHADGGPDVDLSPIIVYRGDADSTDGGETGVADNSETGVDRGTHGGDAISDDGGDLLRDATGDAFADSTQDSPSVCVGPGQELCGGSCVDKSIDPKNCGKCRHDCGGAGCTVGLCDAVTVVASPGTIVDLTSDATSVYWVWQNGLVASGISQADATGGGLPISLGGMQNPIDIAISGTTVGVTNVGPAGIVFWTATAGIANSRAAAGSHTGGQSGHLATVGGLFYVAVTLKGVPGIAVAACPTPSGSGSCANLWSYASGSVGRIVGNADALFWTATQAGATSLVSFWSFASSSQGMLWTGDASALGTDGSYLYWVSGTTILCAPAKPAAQTPVIISPNIPSAPDRLASDGTNVYFGASGAGGTGIYSVPVAGGGPQTLIASALGSATPTAVFTTGGHVYWAENTGSPVIRRVIAP